MARVKVGIRARVKSKVMDGVRVSVRARVSVCINAKVTGCMGASYAVDKACLFRAYTQLPYPLNVDGQPRTGTLRL